ncbi:MAG TPA: helix-turn-helix domain-containing protein [Iamia sp.]
MRADAAANRARILAAAHAAFTTDGLDVPLDAIARRAGVGPGTLHRHFPTKAALLTAAIAVDIDALVAEGQALADAAEPAEALAAFLEMAVQRGAASHALAARIAGTVDVAAATAGPAAALREVMGVLLARAQAAGGVGADVTPAALDAVMAAAHAAFVHPGGGTEVARRVCRSILVA